jgi:glycosyltransferase involved in cell wall biosynthesis
MLRPDALVYYNMDDYACYWRFRGRVIRRLEREVVRKADLSVICARARADALIADVPEAAGRIVHLPHGARGEAIVPRPLDRPLPLPDDVAGLPRPVLGFVGSLEDRVDWTLISNLARAFPEGSIALIGQTPRPMPRAEWYSEFRSAVDLSNVHLVGWRSNVESYASAFDICLIPYLPKHPFNHAACPTKVMDYMATTRPVVSTAVPECALYRGLFHVADSHIEFISCCRRIIDSRSDDGGAAKRWSLARTRTWDRTAAQLSQELFARIGFSARAS